VFEFNYFADYRLRSFFSSDFLCFSKSSAVTCALLSSRNARDVPAHAHSPPRKRNCVRRGVWKPYVCGVWRILKAQNLGAQIPEVGDKWENVTSLVALLNACWAIPRRNSGRCSILATKVDKLVCVGYFRRFYKAHELDLSFPLTRRVFVLVCRLTSWTTDGVRGEEFFWPCWNWKVI
jgi:hypothetical protein